MNQRRHLSHFCFRHIQHAAEEASVELRQPGSTLNLAIGPNGLGPWLLGNATCIHGSFYKEVRNLNMKRRWIGGNMRDYQFATLCKSMH
uniref:Uncharacterized protein n=1 Tax=Rhizophora mucronata TaxID=61149 RepID=A0A2P2INC8_RHIMU